MVYLPQKIVSCLSVEALEQRLGDHCQIQEDDAMLMGASCISCWMKSWGWESDNNMDLGELLAHSHLQHTLILQKPTGSYRRRYFSLQSLWTFIFSF